MWGAVSSANKLVLRRLQPRYTSKQARRRLFLETLSLFHYAYKVGTNICGNKYFEFQFRVSTVAAVSYVEMKEAWLGGKMTPALHDFDMRAMCSFLVEEQYDYRSLRDS